jgi:hypothetical protein
MICFVILCILRHVRNLKSGGVFGWLKFDALHAIKQLLHWEEGGLVS